MITISMDTRDHVANTATFQGDIAAWRRAEVQRIGVQSEGTISRTC